MSERASRAHPDTQVKSAIPMYDGLKALEIPVRPKRPKRKVLKVVLIVVLALGLSYAGYGGFILKKFDTVFKDNTDETLEGLASTAPGQPMNILVIGSDRRDVVSEEERNLPQFNKSSSGKRADTIILLHVSKEKKAVMVSFPRDLRVEIPGYGKNKINAAYSFGGRQLLLDTVLKFTGLEIHHVVDINFVSFRAIVDAVGGVDIYVNRAINDKKSGLKIPGPGCWTMKGQTALSYVRARYFDPRADLGRIDRQQQFMRALLRKVKSIGFLLDLPSVNQLADSLVNGFKVSKDVDFGLARSVAAKLASAGDRNIDFRIVPSDPRFINRTSYVIARPEQTRRLFDAIAADAPIPRVGLTAASVPKPKDVLLDVYNGTKKTGLASKEAARLHQKGFRTRYVQTADKRYSITTIVYQPEAELKAKLVQRLYPGSIIVPATIESFADLKLYLGADVLVSPSSSATPSVSKSPTPRRNVECKEI